jgi:diguanylate cyclase
MAKSNIRQLKKEIQKWKGLACRDELTGLYNRRGFREESEKFIKEAVYSKKHPHRRKSFFVKNFSLVIFDIDDFKKINDTHGHQAGDKALKGLSSLILKKVRDTDLVARWGGEEIVLGLVGANEKNAYEIAEDIRKKVRSSHARSDGKKIGFTISGGVVSFSKIVSFNKIFYLADRALYKAKKRGKNCIVRASSL